MVVAKDELVVARLVDVVLHIVAIVVVDADPTIAITVSTSIVLHTGAIEVKHFPIVEMHPRVVLAMRQTIVRSREPVTIANVVVAIVVIVVAIVMAIVVIIVVIVVVVIVIVVIMMVTART